MSEKINEKIIPERGKSYFCRIKDNISLTEMHITEVTEKTFVHRDRGYPYQILRYKIEDIEFIEEIPKSGI